MTDLTTMNQTQTMSSKEIADLVESRHSDIVRSIQRLMANTVISGYAPTAYTHPQNGQTYECYYLNKRDMLSKLDGSDLSHEQYQ